METTIEVDTAKKKELCSLTLKRTIGGVILVVKSEILEEFFKSISDGTVQTSTCAGWSAGMKYYTYPNLTVPRGDYSRGINLKNFGAMPLLDAASSSFDFSFIRAVGLGGGITIAVPGLFLRDAIETFQKDFKEFLKNYYIQYIKSVEIEIRVTSIC